MITAIGRADSEAALGFVESVFQAHGFSVPFSRYVSGNELAFTQHETVYNIDGLPFVEHNDNLIPYGSNYYRLYREVYLDTIVRHGGAAVEGLFYPMRYAVDTFAAYMQRVPSARSHMLGAKSERVVWRATDRGDEIVDVCRTLDLVFAAHAHDMERRFSVDPRETLGQIEGWRRWPGFPDRKFLVYATDLESGRIVAAMHVNEIWPLWFDCGLLALVKDEDYRPYALANCAHLAAARECYRRADGAPFTLNFGLNPPRVGDYKARFADMEPVIGITSRALL